MGQHRQLVLANRPGRGDIKEDTFRLESVTTPTAASLKDGELLVRVLELGIEPAMRQWLEDARSYIVRIGEVMRSATTGQVVATKSKRFQKGDLVTTTAGWTEYAVVAEKGTKRIEPPKEVKTADYLGPLGLSGQTAYWGLMEVGKIKEGDVVVVSGAAGAVGSYACQIAKLKKCRVYGIAGSQDKCDWLMSLGLEGALNYNDPDFRKQFKKLPYCNVFFDNVAGPILDLVLTRLAQGARIVLCGAISAYNAPQPIKNYLSIISMRATIQGFIVFDFAKRYKEAEVELSKWLVEGSLQRRETRLHGLEQAPEALKGLFSGRNTGKMLVELAVPDTLAKL